METMGPAGEEIFFTSGATELAGPVGAMDSKAIPFSVNSHISHAHQKKNAQIANCSGHTSLCVGLEWL